MQDLVLDETMEDMDKNGDGYVTLQEYVGTPTAYLWSPVLSWSWSMCRGYLAKVRERVGCGGAGVAGQ